MNLSDEKFRIEIENRFGPYLGAVTPAGPRWSYPLNFTLAQSYVAPRLARDFGMGAVGKIKPLRAFFMKQAGADMGALPSLMAREG